MKAPSQPGVLFICIYTLLQCTIGSEDGLMERVRWQWGSSPCQQAGPQSPGYVPINPYIDACMQAVEELLAVPEAAPAFAAQDWAAAFVSQRGEFDYWVDEVEGTLPDFLRGTLFRNGPGNFGAHAWWCCKVRPRMACPQRLEVVTAHGQADPHVFRTLVQMQSHAICEQGLVPQATTMHTDGNANMYCALFMRRARRRALQAHAGRRRLCQQLRIWPRQPRPLPLALRAHQVRALH